jgi:UTP:GlnB (protein PII) uridylyltransferase
MRTTLDAHVERHAALSSRVWKVHRTHLYEAAVKQLGDRIGPDELDVHFATMPARYWQQVDRAGVLWHLETIHQFFEALANPDTPGTAPVVAWRPGRDRGTTELVVCTWDRQGLLAKAAGVLAETSLNILQADIYTRADNVVLDIFHVSSTTGRRPPTKVQLAEVYRRLAEALRAG